MNVWRLIPHHIDRQRAIAWTRKNNRISIGWNRVGDITNYHSQTAVKQAIELNYPVPPFKRNSCLGAPSLWDLCHSMKADDLVIINGAAGQPVLVVQVKGDYEFAGKPLASHGQYQHQRRVQLTQINPERLWKMAGEASGRNVYQTLILCTCSIKEEQLPLDSL